MAKLIVALDLPSSCAVLGLIDELGDAVSFYKVGSPLFTRAGPQIVRELRMRGKRVFLDLKYHDIPSTVAHATESAAALDVELLTLHAAGGAGMMRAARDAIGSDGPRLLGVTVLTSFTPDDVEQVWSREVRSIRDEVTRLASLAADAGMDGAVASPLEVSVLKRRLGTEFLVATPGIRPEDDRPADQVRVATAAEAARDGADYLIVGRPILEADDRLAVVEQIQAEAAEPQVTR